MDYKMNPEVSDCAYRTEQQGSRLSRRTFLRGLSTTIVGTMAGTMIGSLLAACGSAIPEQVSLSTARGAPQGILPSPQPPAAATATPHADDSPLAEFLALSAVLTGISTLNPVLGRVYLQSLQANTQFEVTVAELLEQGGFGSAAPPATIDELEASGIFQSEPTRRLADKIIEYWYTGIYDTAEGEQVVATYVDALTWVTLTFTKPTTICGSPGFWAERPEEGVF